MSTFDFSVVEYEVYGDTYPWWRVDLGGEHCISKVTVLNRGDMYSKRF